MVGGLCIGDEWAGDPVRRRRPWRDTMVRVDGPAVAALDRAFGRIWGRTGGALPFDELAADPPSGGTSTVRVVEGAPRRARVYRGGAVGGERGRATVDHRRLPRRTGAALCRPARRRPRRRRRPPPRPGYERSSGVAQLHARRLPRAVAGGGAHLRVSRPDRPRQADAGRPPL